MTHPASSIRPWPVVAAAYVLLALIYTWPVALHFTTRLPIDLGDPVMSLTLLRWNLTAPLFSQEWWNGVGYYPLSDTVTFSDPRLGLTLIAAPAYWLTGSMVAGYNTAYIVSFVLSALAAHLLIHALTRSHAAAVVAGCAYGFAPFRAAHLSHLELLAGFWMPIVLLALHRWRETGRRAWLAVFGASLAAQGYFCAYYVPMMGVVIGAWQAWFALDPRRLPRLAGPVLAAALAVASLVPLYRHYDAAHRAAGFARSLGEIEYYSADLGGLLSAPHLTRVWPALPTRSPEGQIFPGLAVVSVIAVALWRGRRRDSSADAAEGDSSTDFTDSRPSEASAVGSRSGSSAGTYQSASSAVLTRRRWLLVVAAGAGVAAAAAAVFGPIRLNLGIVSLSVTELRKPLTIVLLALVAYGLTSASMVAAVRARSVLAFYVLAAVLMLLLALGPNPAAFGVPFLYEAPYGWLMALPGFGSLRAPARFAMPMTLMLAVAAGMAWHRLRPSSGRRALWATPVLAAFIVAEAWVAPSATLEPAAAFEWPQACAGVPRLELPFGDVEFGAAAQHRALVDGVRSVNGATGFVPPFADALEIASRRRDTPALVPILRHGPLCVSVDVSHDEAGDLAAWIAAHPGASPLEGGAGRRFFHLPQAPRADVPEGGPLPIVSVTARPNPVSLHTLTDGDRTTVWTTRRGQNRQAALAIELGCRASVTHVALSQGTHAISFPRTIRVERPRVRGGWRVAWEGPIADLAVDAAIRDPRLITIVIPVEAGGVTRLRVRPRERDRAPWAIAELAVLGHCRGRRPR